MPIPVLACYRSDRHVNKVGTVYYWNYSALKVAGYSTPTLQFWMSADGKGDSSIPGSENTKPIFLLSKCVNGVTYFVATMDECEFKDYEGYEVLCGPENPFGYIWHLGVPQWTQAGWMQRLARWEASEGCLPHRTKMKPHPIDWKPPAIGTDSDGWVYQGMFGYVMKADFKLEPNSQIYADDRRLAVK